MNTIISKSQFKPKALEYLRFVEELKTPLTITHEGKPVVRVIPYTEEHTTMPFSLKETVVSYANPTSPIDDTQWEALS